jgi:hypothetical protein
MSDPEETEVEPVDETGGESASAVSDEGADSTGARPRRKLVMTLTVIAVLVGFLSIMSTWVLRQTLETDTWVETSAKMIENDEIRQALSVYLVDQLYDNIDVEAEVKTLLPPEVKGLAGPAAGGLRQVADKAANEALSRPAVQSIWVDANRAAHATFVEILEGGSDNVSTSEGNVVINVKGLLEQVTADIGIGTDLVDKLPADAGQIEVFKSDELENAQAAVDAFQTLDWVIYLIALGLFALAVFLAKGWRRVALRNVGIAFIVLGLLALIARSVGGNAVVSALVSDADIKPAADAAWGIATDELARMARSAAFFGLLLFAGALFAGPSRAATRMRAALAPYLAEPWIAFPSAVVLLLLLTWWSPAGVMDRLDAFVLIGLFLLIGTELLRRQVTAEFPEEAGAENRAKRRSDRVEGVKQGASGAWKKTSTAVAGIGSSRKGKQEPADPEAARLERLQQLAALKESGALTEEEFEAEKRRAMADPAKDETDG